MKLAPLSRVEKDRLLTQLVSAFQRRSPRLKRRLVLRSTPRVYRSKSQPCAPDSPVQVVLQIATKAARSTSASLQSRRLALWSLLQHRTNSRAKSCAISVVRTGRKSIRKPPPARTLFILACFLSLRPPLIQETR